MHNTIAVVAKLGCPAAVEQHPGQVLTESPESTAEMGFCYQLSSSCGHECEEVYVALRQFFKILC